MANHDENTFTKDWASRVLENAFLRLAPGKHRLLILDEPEPVVNNYGNETLQFKVMLPNHQKGLFSTSAQSVLIPLARHFKKFGFCKGSVLSFTATGEDTARRYTDVTVELSQQTALELPETPAEDEIPF